MQVRVVNLFLCPFASQYLRTFRSTVANAEIRNFLSAGDVVFLPTNREGISLALMEGMSMGLVPVSVDVGGQKELITDDVGFLIPLSSSDRMTADFTKHLTALHDNPLMRLKMSQAAEKRVGSMFSLEAMVAGMEREFCNAINAPRSPPDMRKLIAETARNGAEFLRVQDELVDIWNKYQAALEVPPHTAGVAIQPIHTQWAQGALLLGVGINDTVEMGTKVALTLVWTAMNGPLDANYITFIHFKDGDEIVFNGDRFPVTHDKPNPTNTWKKGEVIIDTNLVFIPDWIKPGRYSIALGLYNPGKLHFSPVLLHSHFTCVYRNWFTTNACHQSRSVG